MRDDSEREIIKAWLERILADKRWSKARLAKAAGMHPSTIGRATSEEEPEGGDPSLFLMSTRSLQKVARATGYELPRLTTDRDVAERPENVVDDLEQMPKATGVPQGQIECSVISRVLDLLGILPGDRLRVDPTALAQPHSIVTATLTAEPSVARQLLRVYEPPFLLTHSTDPKQRLKPQIVDDERVRISGVVVTCIRDMGEE